MKTSNFNPANVSHVKMYADNVRTIWDRQDAIICALSKKIRKGIAPDAELLARSSSVRRIAASAKRAAAVDTWCRPSAADMEQLRREISYYIIECAFFAAKSK